MISFFFAVSPSSTLCQFLSATDLPTSVSSAGTGGRSISAKSGGLTSSAAVSLDAAAGLAPGAGAAELAGAAVAAGSSAGCELLLAQAKPYVRARYWSVRVTFMSNAHFTIRPDGDELRVTNAGARRRDLRGGRS